MQRGRGRVMRSGREVTPTPNVPTSRSEPESSNTQSRMSELEQIVMIMATNMANVMEMMGQLQRQFNTQRENVPPPVPQVNEQAQDPPPPPPQNYQDYTNRFTIC